MVVFHFNESGNNILLRRFVNHVDRDFLEKSKTGCHRNSKTYLILKIWVSGSGAPGESKSHLMSKDSAKHWVIFIHSWRDGHHSFRAHLLISTYYFYLSINDSFYYKAIYSTWLHAQLCLNFVSSSSSSPAFVINTLDFRRAHSPNHLAIWSLL